MAQGSDTGEIRDSGTDMTVEIDPRSGFCGGVIRAIDSAEHFLADHPGERLYSLGSIVHNEAELARLADEGLVRIDSDDLDEMVSAEGETLLIRAHGEPPQTYAKAERLKFRVIDCTCPVVLRLQKSIRETYEKIRRENPSGRILLFGKIGHAEVLGLVGQVNGDVVVVENMKMLETALSEGLISPDAPLEVFSQTTKNPDEYSAICRRLIEYAGGNVVVHNTICAQVADRHKRLSEFAANHDVILFVSGRESSNGNVLCDLCQSVNIRTYHIQTAEDVRQSWFSTGDSVGVCGATSTPKWLLEQVADRVRSLER